MATAALIAGCGSGAMGTGGSPSPTPSAAAAPTASPSLSQDATGAPTATPAAAVTPTAAVTPLAGATPNPASPACTATLTGPAYTVETCKVPAQALAGNLLGSPATIDAYILKPTGYETSGLRYPTFVGLLNAAGIPVIENVFNGGHVDQVDNRIRNHMLPFMAQFLADR